MCGRFVRDIAPEMLASIYRLTALPELPARYNIAPGQPVAAVRENHAGARELVELRWGLVPHWARDPAIGARMINARSETVAEKPSFRQALRSRRCIIPASGFYEWAKLGKQKLPHYIRLRAGEIMSLAGLWESWTSPGGEHLESCTILTTAANRLIRTIHDRMPVILHDEKCSRWLSREFDDVDQLAELFQPYPSGRLEEYLVSQAVNRPGHDAPDCILPA